MKEILSEVFKRKNGADLMTIINNNDNKKIINCRLNMKVVD